MPITVFVKNTESLNKCDSALHQFHVTYTIILKNVFVYKFPFRLVFNFKKNKYTFLSLIIEITYLQLLIELA